MTTPTVAATPAKRTWPFAAQWRWFMKRSLLTRVQIVGGVSIFIIVSVIIAVYSHQLQHHLDPIANKLQHIKAGWLVVCSLIALVSIPPLFGHELLAAIAGYVYGTLIGFAMVTIASLVGETFVYFSFRYFFKSQLDRFRRRHKANYGVFVGVVEDGGLLMLFFIRSSVIPPHFSTPLFSSLETITWTRWMLANLLASPVKFFPPVYIGVLLRDKTHNSVLGNVAFGLSMAITIGTLWFVIKAYKLKKKALLEAAEHEAVVQEEGTELTEVATPEMKETAVLVDEERGSHWAGPSASVSMPASAHAHPRH